MFAFDFDCFTENIIYGNKNTDKKHRDENRMSDAIDGTKRYSCIQRLFFSHSFLTIPTLYRSHM